MLVGTGAAAAIGAGIMQSGDHSMGALVAAILSGWFVCGGAAALHRWAGVLVGSMLALSVSLYLGVQHAGLSESICSVSATFDCDKVNTSTYSELFGVPIAFLGSGFYAAVALISVLSLRFASSGRYSRGPHLVAAGGLLSVAYSVFLAGASMSLGAWCLFCISLYGLNLLITVCAWQLCRNTDRGVVAGTLEGLSGKVDRSFGAMVGGGLVVLIGAMWWNSGAGTAPVAKTSQDLSKLFESTEGSLNLDGTEAALGPVGAQVTVVEFADLQCGACAASFPKLMAFSKDNPDVRVLFKHYPLSSVCNEGIQGERHKDACGAAASAECALEQGRFWDLVRLMFANQRDLDEDGRAFLARQVGLDMAAYEPCLVRPDIALGIRLDVQHANTVGVHATPSIFVKGISTDGKWVSIRGGVSALSSLVQAHRDGRTIPATPAPVPHQH